MNEDHPLWKANDRLLKNLLPRLMEFDSQVLCPRPSAWGKLVEDVRFVIEQTQIILAIDELRSLEGDVVTIFCDNPESEPRNAILCSGGWTNYEDSRFEGNSVLQSLQKAVAKYREAK